MSSQELQETTQRSKYLQVGPRRKGPKCQHHEPYRHSPAASHAPPLPSLPQAIKCRQLGLVWHKTFLSCTWVMRTGSFLSLPSYRRKAKPANEPLPTQPPHNKHIHFHSSLQPLHQPCPPGVSPPAPYPAGLLPHSPYPTLTPSRASKHFFTELSHERFRCTRTALLDACGFNCCVHSCVWMHGLIIDRFLFSKGFRELC